MHSDILLSKVLFRSHVSRNTIKTEKNVGDSWPQSIPSLIPPFFSPPILPPVIPKSPSTYNFNAPALHAWNILEPVTINENLSIHAAHVSLGIINRACIWNPIPFLTISIRKTFS